MQLSLETSGDPYILGFLWAYCNTPHDSTGEKTSYLLFGIDCRAPLESSLLSAGRLAHTSVTRGFTFVTG